MGREPTSHTIEGIIVREYFATARKLFPLPEGGGQAEGEKGVGYRFHSKFTIKTLPVFVVA